MTNQKVYLMILDGFGEGKDYEGNAITHSSMPCLTQLKSEYPHTLLACSSESVGLPPDTQGGSEVGHFTIGAGRVVFQVLEEINRSIRNGEFFIKPALLEAAKNCLNNDKNLHLLGMISDQGIHAHIAHLFSLMDFADQQKIKTVYIHAITDGRDVPEKTAKQFIKQINQKISDLKDKGSKTEFKIATIIGRYFAMDRDNNWDRTEKAYKLLTEGIGNKETDPIAAIDHAYARGVETDYYIDPIILDADGLIRDNDSVIFFNYRTDRTKQLTYCFTEETEIGFKKTVNPKTYFVCFGDYSKKAPVVFPPAKLDNNLGEVIAANHLKQLRIAETEKYAHVTFFFNSQKDAVNEGEDRIMIESPKVPSYAEKPEMSAPAITERVISEINSKKYDLIIQNFANPDLVGHSGNMNATVKACETIDQCISKIYNSCKANNYALIITADHGNAEYMVYEDSHENCPSHSKNPVIFLLASEQLKTSQLQNNGGLQDIAPTILKLMDISQPAEMTGKSLI